jgi:hypothetical protein
MEKVRRRTLHNRIRFKEEDMHLTCKDHKRRVVVFEVPDNDVNATSQWQVVHRADSTRVPGGNVCKTEVVRIGGYEYVPGKVIDGFQSRTNHVAGANYQPLSDINPNLVVALQGQTPEENLLTEIFEGHEQA